MQLFSKPADYQAFVQIVAETLEKIPLPIAAFVLMPNHWHFVVRPQKTGQLAAFFQRVTVTHAMRWQRYQTPCGLRSRIPRSLQVVSDPRRRTFLARRSIRRAKPTACDARP